MESTTLPIAPPLARLPTGRAIAIGAAIGSLVGAIAASLCAYPGAPTLAPKLPIAAAIWVVLALPMLLRAFFGIVLQGALSRFGGVPAALLTAAIEGWLFAQLAILQFSIVTSEQTMFVDYGPERRAVVAFALGPCVYAIVRYFGGSYAMIVTANVVAFAIDLL